MNKDILYLIAIVFGIIHIVLRPDYYAPILTISKEKNWSSNKTLGVTLFSSIGHILGSVVLSGAGLAPAILVARLRYFSSMRETILVWFLILFGLLFVFYGIRQAYRSRPHKHLQLFPDGTYHTHTHIHKKDSALVDRLTKKKDLTIWSLFVSYALTPCEALIVLQVWPAIHSHYMMIVVVTMVFSLATIITMLLMTYLILHGRRFPRFRRIGLFSYLIVGILIVMYGLALTFL